LLASLLALGLRIEPAPRLRLWTSTT